MPIVAQAGSGGSLLGFMPFAVMIAIFYFLIIRPQMKRQKEHQSMQDSLSTGDHVVTNGGVHGVIKAIKDNAIISVKIAENTVIEMDRGAVSRKKNSQEAD